MKNGSKQIYKVMIYIGLLLFPLGSCMKPQAINQNQLQPPSQKRSIDKKYVDVNAFDSDGMTPLHLAANKGEMEMVHLLIKAGADVNLSTRDKEPWKPIHYAVRYGDLKMVELLLDAGAKIDVPTYDGLYPIHIAAQNGRNLILKRLIEIDPNVNKMTADSEPWAPIHLAIRNGHVETTQILIDANADTQLTTRDQYSWTPLHFAARYGTSKIVKALLKSGANPNVIDKDKWAPIHLAVQYGNGDMVKKVIEHGAHINMITKGGWHPIHLASRYNKIEIVKLLLKKGVDPNILTEDEEPWSALLFSINYSSPKIAKTLLAAGANPNIVDKDGWSPLHISIQNNMPEISHLLIKAGAKINVKGNDGWTPLHLAIRYGRKDLIKRLIDSGANVNSKTSEQWSLLHFATRYSDTETVKELIANNAGINVYNSSGSAPIHFATCFSKDPEMVKALINAGADVNSSEKDKESWAPIHYAAGYNNASVLDLLLKAKAKINVKNGIGWYPIHYAARYGDAVMLKLLIKAGADPNVMTDDKRPWAPIHLATRYGDAEMVKTLVDAGALLNVKTLEENPLSPIELAINYGHADMVNVLLNPAKNYNDQDSERLTENIKSAPSLFLWKLEEKNSVIYLFGSFHYGTKGIYPLDKRIYDAYNVSNTLVVENNVIKKQKKSALNKLFEEGRFKKDESLNDYLSFAQKETFNRILGGYGMSLNDFKHLKPWLIYLQISDLELKNNGYNPEIGIDRHFLKKAKMDKKNIEELETMEEQASFLSEMTVNDLLKQIKADHQLNASISTVLNELISLWKAGKAEEFGEAFSDSIKNCPDYLKNLDILIKQRNVKWIEKIENMIDEGEKYFIVVGAAHMAGDDNLIQLLTKAGHKVSQL